MKRQHEFQHLPSPETQNKCFTDIEFRNITHSNRLDLIALEYSKTKGRGFVSHRGQAKFSLAQCGHTQRSITNISVLLQHNAFTLKFVIFQFVIRDSI